MYDACTLPLRPELVAAHETAWHAIAGPGTFWTGAERISIVEEARHALACELCTARKAALSPASVRGAHTSLGQLSDAAVEAIHMIRNDPGRLTRRWVDAVLAAGLSREAYVELVGVMNTATIIDGFARGIGLEPAALPPPKAGEPARVANDKVVDVGGWVPVLAVEDGEGIGGMPSAPMIGRAMGLVPEAITLFISVVRAHYNLAAFPCDLSRPQIELIAARVSAINECFY